jgi:hypothetical protein
MKIFVFTMSLFFVNFSTASSLFLPKKKIQLKISDAGLKDSLSFLFSDIPNLKLELEKHITNDIKISANFDNTEWASIFESILKQGDLKYEVTRESAIFVSRR